MLPSNITSRPQLSIMIVILAATFFLACEKSKEEEDPQLTISNFDPVSGAVSTVVTITGSGFSATANENVVRFNNKDAVVQSASAITLIVIVPESAGTGPISIQRGTKSVSSSTDFEYLSAVTVSTFAGSSTAGFVDGSGTNAKFFHPIAVATDKLRNLYVADAANHSIRKITPQGMVTTLAGNGTSGSEVGNGINAQFYHPSGITTDAQGNVYVADSGNNRICKITADGEVSVLAGSGTEGFQNGAASLAQFAWPTGIAIDSEGNIYVSDDFNHSIRKISSGGTVSTVAGNGTFGYADGTGNSARFGNPNGLATDSEGNIYVADLRNNRIRKITPDGTTSTIAGSDVGFADGDGSMAQFSNPIGIAVDSKGNMYISDFYNNRIRKITPTGAVSTLAGSDTAGSTDGEGSIAKFNGVSGIAIDLQGDLYVADGHNNLIRKIVIN